MKKLSCKDPLQRGALPCLGVLLMIAMAGNAGIAQAQAQNEAESLVLRQAASGKEAELGNLPPEKRKIRADFLAPLLMGTMQGARVSHEGVLIKDAVIEGRLALAGAEIPFATWLTNCEFKDDVDLSHSHLNGDLSVVGSTFRGGADLDGLRAEGHVVLDLARFEGLFDISDARINGNLEASGATFSDRNGNPAQFDNVKGISRADLDHLTLEVPLTLDGAEAQIITLGKVKSVYAPQNLKEKAGLYAAKTIILSHAAVHRDLQIIGTEVDRLLANGLKVEGVTTIENVRITGQADLSHAQLFSLVLGDDVVWPPDEASLQLAGISFQYISPDIPMGGGKSGGTIEEAKWEKLSVWVDHASFTTAPYQQLEDVLKKQGRVEQANDVYKRMRKRTWTQGGLTFVGKIKNAVLYLLVGYGREPNWAFYWCLPVVFIGWIVFRRREDVEPKDPRDKDRAYDPLWYSIDLFLPLSTLQAADAWIPRQDSRFKRYYARVHSILGWILVPIGLAAVSGLISGR